MNRRRLGPTAFSFPKFKLRHYLDPRPGNSGKLPHRVGSSSPDRQVSSELDVRMLNIGVPRTKENCALTNCEAPTGPE